MFCLSRSCSSVISLSILLASILRILQFKREKRATSILLFPQYTCTKKHSHFSCLWGFRAVWCQLLLQRLDVFVVYITETCCQLPCRSAHGPLTLAECSAADCLSVMVNVSWSSVHFEPHWFHSLSWHWAQAGQHLHFICLHTHICLFIKGNPQKANGPLCVPLSR